MSSFIDKAKAKAQQLASTAKEKVDDYKDTKKADDLLDDLGRILYRQRTDRAEPTDEASITHIVAQLKALEDEGAPVLHAKQAAPEAETAETADTAEAAPAADAAPPAAPEAPAETAGG